MILAVMALAVMNGEVQTPAPPSLTTDRDIFVAMDLLVGDEGRVKSCSVTETDAPVPFQHAACGAMLERARFYDSSRSSVAAAGEHVQKTMKFTAGEHPLSQTDKWHAYIQTRPVSGDNEQATRR